MRKIVMTVILVCMIFPASVLWGDDFLGAPVMSGGKTIRSQKSRLEKLYDMGYPEAVKYYQDVLKNSKDIKFWDRKTETYIEDHSNRPWHSITISKEPKGTKVVIVKDNWTWIIGTLVLRFVAVFVVLLMLYVAMTVSGAVLSRIGNAAESRK